MIIPWSKIFILFLAKSPFFSPSLHIVWNLLTEVVKVRDQSIPYQIAVADYKWICRFLSLTISVYFYFYLFCTNTKSGEKYVKGWHLYIDLSFSEFLGMFLTQYFILSNLIQVEAIIFSYFCLIFFFFFVVLTDIFYSGIACSFISVGLISHL